MSGSGIGMSEVLGFVVRRKVLALTASELFW